MTVHLLFVSGFLLLPLFGLWTWGLDAVRRMEMAARVAVAGAAGALVTAVAMALLSAIGVEWSRTTLIVVMTIVAIPGVRIAWSSRRTPADQPSEHRRRRPRASVAALLFVVLTGYGILTARESAGDLQFFWAPKAVGFFRAGGIDADLLADPVHANRDYPPLFPLLLAWSHTIAKQFSWWGALLTSLLCLIGSVAIVRGFSGDDHGAVLVAATLAFTFAVGFAAGGADPPLLLFETLVLAAMAFVGERRACDVLLAIGLAGAAWTKIEGATFVIAVVVAIAVVHRNVRRALTVAAPAALLLGGWLIFLIRHELVFGYGGARMTIYLSALPQTLLLTAKHGQYELFGLPWVAPLILILAGRDRRAARFPLLVAALTTGAAIFFYIHFFDPAWWIAASAPRVLLTPLLALLIGAIAANPARQSAEPQ